ncbi:MAG: hypothetical protein A2W91_12885 [Bacteroidetes bacterium GWF2_38_335]|nr:MAG: hypothetical protein A2W91_12885 [Bacteroidetes bacterium GWF2_38_335]
MKKLILKTESYQYIEESFRQWLDVLGFCSGSIYNMPSIAREFFYFLENSGVTNIRNLEQIHIKRYYDHISTRANQRRGGGLSKNYINKQVQGVEKLLEYLHHKGLHTLPTTGIRLLKLERSEITIITPEQAKMLYKATETEPDNIKQEATNSRDRAMLTIFYGCGLRRNEGEHLDVGDINFDTGTLHVKRGKNYKQRFVPFNKTNSNHLQQYVYDYRPILLKGKTEGRLFISVKGRPMTGGSLYCRLKQLQQKTDDTELQQKTLTLHALRHSIATHLLQNGMPLEKISRFLGHSSLESTQIYTHLVQTH